MDTLMAWLGPLFPVAPEAILIATAEGHIVAANPAARILFGTTPEELLRQTGSDLVAPGARWPVPPPAELLVVGSWQGDLELRTRTGKLVPVAARAVALPSPAGLLVAVFLHDRTARVAVETALAHEQALLQTVIDHFPDAVYLKDVSSRFVRLNPVAARTLGIADPAEALGKTDFDFFPEALARRYFADEQQVLTSGEPLLNRLEPQSEDGAVWWLTSTVPLRDPQGSVIGLIGSGRDITERLRVEEALRASEARHRALLTALPDLVFRFDRAGTYLDVKAERLGDLVAPPKDVLGRRLAEVLPEEVATLLMEAIAQVLASRQPTTREYDLELAGEWRSFEARLVAEGQDEVVVVVRDVTDRHRREADLRAALAAAEAANHATRQFLAMMSHELRTPLQAILGYAELLLTDPVNVLTPAQAEDVRTIHAGAGRLVALIAQMLDLSRLEAGQVPLRALPVDVATILAEVQQQVAPQAAARGLALHLDPPGDLPPILGDELGVYQIVLNLVGNAVKFTESGEVAVHADAAEGAVTITVRDTGIGIASEDQAQIFEPFRQAGRGMTRRYEGAGLGLAIVKQLVAQQGGRISVMSQLGEGSTFTVVLPAAPPTPTRA